MVDLMGTVPPEQLLRSGAVGAICYTSKVNRRKCPKPGYAARLVALGGRVAFVYEDGASSALRGHQAGVDHGRYAVTDVRAQGYPAGCTIFATADFDAHPDQIRDYVHGFAQVVRASGYQVGLYANGLCIRTFKAEGLVSVGWLTCSGGFRGSKDHTGADLWQRCTGQRPMLTIPGYSIDTNVLLAERVGAWGEPAPVAARPKVIADFPGVIHPGDTGHPVAMWAFVLTACGYRGFTSRPYALARQMGVGKVHATKRFQRRHHLPATGVVDRATWDAAGRVLEAKRGIR